MAITQLKPQQRITLIVSETTLPAGPIIVCPPVTTNRPKLFKNCFLKEFIIEPSTAQADELLPITNITMLTMSDTSDKKTQPDSSPEQLIKKPANDFEEHKDSSTVHDELETSFSDDEEAFVQSKKDLKKIQTLENVEVQPKVPTMQKWFSNDNIEVKDHPSQPTGTYFDQESHV